MLCVRPMTKCGPGIESETWRTTEMALARSPASWCVQAASPLPESGAAAIRRCAYHALCGLFIWGAEMAISYAMLLDGGFIRRKLGTKKDAS